MNSGDNSRERAVVVQPHVITMAPAALGISLTPTERGHSFEREQK